MNNPFEEITERLSSIENCLLAIKEHTEPNQKKSSEKEDELLTIAETAKLFKVTKPTIFAWKKEGKINALRIGSSVRFKKSELLSALQSKKTRRGTL